jgi:CDP-6-deoxy-D-xylo-4-hexulose-3-dehydrase
VLGLNAITQDLITTCRESNIRLIEDVCESHGAVFEGRRCGSIGYASNFSFYYAHHLTTIEGGAICTDDEEFNDTVRMLRSHGMVRESENVDRRTAYAESFPDLNPDFIFAYASHNHRPTELNGVLGLAQLPRLDENNEIRRRNFRLFMSLLDPQMYRTWFDTESSSNYAFILVLQEPDFVLRDLVEQRLMSRGIEFRRGLSGGGNQLRQPYLRALIPEIRPEDFPNTEHVHNFGWYIGNYPDLGTDRVEELCNLLNSI